MPFGGQGLKNVAAMSSGPATLSQYPTIGLPGSPGFEGQWKNSQARPIGEQDGRVFYTNPGNQVFSGNAERPSYVYQDWANPEWMQGVTEQGTFGGQQGFWIGADQVNDPNFKTIQTGSFRGEKKDDSFLPSWLAPALTMASFAFPGFAPLAYGAAGANVIQGVESGNPLQAALGLYGGLSYGNILPSPVELWDNVTSGAPLLSQGTQAAAVGFDTPGGMSVPGSGGGGPMSTNTSWLDAVDNAGVSGNIPFIGGGNAPPIESFFPGYTPPTAAATTPIASEPNNIVDYVKSTFGPGDFVDPKRKAGIKGLWDIGTGAYGAYKGYEMQNLAKEYAGKADPFGPQRGYYASQLQALQANPSMVTQLPQYKAGLDAIARQNASQGYLGSGNSQAMSADFAAKLYQSELERLAGLAGAGISPAAGAQIGVQGHAAGVDQVGAALNRLGYGVAQF